MENDDTLLGRFPVPGNISQACFLWYIRFRFFLFLSFKTRKKIIFNKCANYGGDVLWSIRIGLAFYIGWGSSIFFLLLWMYVHTCFIIFCGKYFLQKIPSFSALSHQPSECPLHSFRSLFSVSRLSPSSRQRDLKKKTVRGLQVRHFRRLGIYCF